MNTPPVPYIELNLSNYDAEDVAQLNEWAIWAFGYIEELEMQIRAKDARISGLDEELARLQRVQNFQYRSACEYEQRFIELRDMVKEFVDNGSYTSPEWHDRFWKAVNGDSQ